MKGRQGALTTACALATAAIMPGKGTAPARQEVTEDWDPTRGMSAAHVTGTGAVILHADQTALTALSAATMYREGGQGNRRRKTQARATQPGTDGTGEHGTG